MAKIGIVGTGWGARVQVPAFREAGLEIGGIAGRDPAKTGKLAAELGVRAFDSWRELIDADVDLVSIVTPPSEHLEMASAALAAGKHVISEKPTAMNAGEAEELVARAREHPHRIALIDHELRFLPSFRVAREALLELGPIRYVEVRYASPSRGNRDRAWNWWSDANRGGGILGAVASHFIDALRYFGFEIEAAQATLATIIDERPHEGGYRAVTSDDYATLNLRLRSAGILPAGPLASSRQDAGGPAGWKPALPIATMSFSAVSSAPDEPSLLTMHTERGALRLTGEELLGATPQTTFQRLAGGDMEKRPGNSPGGAFGSGTVHLGRALKAALDDGDRSALAPAATFEDGLAQQRVLDAARRSASSNGCWVTCA